MHLHARAMLVVFPRAPGHPFEPEGLGQYWPSSPTAPKLLARQQDPCAACRAAATQPVIRRTTVRSIALPQAAPSQGSQSWRVGTQARGSSRLRDCNKCRTGNLRLLSPVWLSPEASADTERRDQHTRAPQKSAAGGLAVGRRRRVLAAGCPTAACCRRSHNPGADPAGLRADSVNVKP